MKHIVIAHHYMRHREKPWVCVTMRSPSDHNLHDKKDMSKNNSQRSANIMFYNYYHARQPVQTCKRKKRRKKSAAT